MAFDRTKSAIRTKPKDVSWSEWKGLEDHVDGFDYFDGASNVMTDGTTITVRHEGYLEVECSTYGPYRLYPGQPLPKFNHPTRAVDLTGTSYGVGDMVAVAIVSRKSPQLVYGQVTKLICDPDKYTRNGDLYFEDSEYHCGFYWAYHDLLGWGTQIQPLLDGRGFNRDENDKGLARKQIYTFCNNIVATPNFKY